MCRFQIFIGAAGGAEKGPLVTTKTIGYDISCSRFSNNGQSGENVRGIAQVWTFANLSAIQFQYNTIVRQKSSQFVDMRYESTCHTRRETEMRKRFSKTRRKQNATRPPPVWLLFTSSTEIRREKHDLNSPFSRERFRTFFPAFFFALNFGWGS